MERAIRADGAGEGAGGGGIGGVEAPEALVVHVVRPHRGGGQEQLRTDVAHLDARQGVRPFLARDAVPGEADLENDRPAVPNGEREREVLVAMRGLEGHQAEFPLRQALPVLEIALPQAIDKEEQAVKQKMSASREKQIRRLEQQADKIEKWLNENDKKIGAYGKELHSNVTDNDSAKMHTSHGTVQGYNGQAIVDSKHQVIVHGEAIGKGLDNDNLPPVVDGAKENLESIGKAKDYFEGKIVTADSSYHSVTNIKKCNEEKLDAYIPDNKFRNRDKRFASRVGYRPRSKKFTFADFKYDRDKDQYICPNGKQLKRFGKLGRHKGKLLKVYRSSEADCKRCQIRVKCLQNKNAKGRYLSYYADASGKNISQAMVKKIETQSRVLLFHQ